MSKNEPCWCEVQYIQDVQDSNGTLRHCTKCGNTWVKSGAEVLDEKTLFVDPFQTVPLGFRCPVNKYTVVGFCGGGGTMLSEMVYIRYDGIRPCYLCSTTRDYITVLNDYKNYVDSLPSRERLIVLGHNPIDIDEIFGR